MKVLHVIPSIGPVLGGLSQAVLETVKALNKLGIEAEIATTNANGKELLNVPLGKCTNYQQVPIWFFPRFSPPIDSLREFSVSGDFTSWLWQNIHNYDLLHINGIFSYTSTIAMAIACLLKVPYIIAPHGMLCTWSLQQAKQKKAFYLKLIEKNCLNQAQAIHFTAVQEQQEVSQLNLKPSGFVLPLGISIPPTIPHAREKLRTHLNIPPDQPIILYLSRLHYKKGLNYLIPALGKLSHYRFTFVLAGSGEPKYETEMKNLVSAHGLQQNTHFVGFVKGEIKNLLLQGSDLFALTSYSENFGIAVLESLAAGVPVILTPGVALSDIVQQQHLGYVTEMDVDAIATSIEKTLTHPEQTKQMGDRARQFILENYTWDSIASKMLSVYQDLIIPGK